MKAEKTPEPPNSDDSPGQKEDPLERRRLQNRLSQRNHRRKIRDRIAKLQERVIANELRAAAALNGWDQQYVPSPLLSTRRVSPNSHFNMSSRDPAADLSTQFAPSYVPAAPWSREMTLPASPGLLGDQTCYIDEGLSTESMCWVPSSSDWVNNAGMQPSTCGSEDMFQDMFATGDSLPREASNPSNQPQYYVATETALPQILQVLSTVSPQAKIIVLVPPDSASAAAAGYPSPAPIFLGNGLEPLSSPQIIATLGCQCQTQNLNSRSTTQMVPGAWSVPGPYVPGCPSHKMQSSLSGGFSVMRR